jgi:anti-anti-sigma factor
MGGGNTGMDSLLLGSDPRGWFVTARGSIRAMLCFPLRDELLARLDDLQDTAGVFVDLAECRYMDSTFIGLLVAMDRRLRGGGGGRLHLLRPSPECRDLLGQLGLLEVLRIDEEAPVPPDGMREIAERAEKPGAEFILKAHEALMETSEEARKKFSVLKEMLERKLKSEKHPPDTP